ncbi:hypothetical protein JNM05_11495 [bacterium]|nr:hypothetical protein [bacterium]
MLPKTLLRGIPFLLFISLFISCGPRSQMLNQADWQANKDNKVHARVTVFIANVDLETKIISASNDKLVVSQNGQNAELPVEVISKIVFSGDHNKKKKIIWGSVIGGVLGIAGGYAVGSAASSEGGAAAIAHPLSMVMILGGIVGGGFAGSSFTKYEEYSFNNELVPYILDEDLGPEITPAELRGYSIFENLTNDSDEKVLQVQIFKMKSGKFFLLYDVTSLGSYGVKWQTVDEDYLQTQKAKIKTQK